VEVVVLTVALPLLALAVYALTVVRLRLDDRYYIVDDVALWLVVPAVAIGVLIWWLRWLGRIRLSLEIMTFRARICFEVELAHSVTGLDAPVQIEAPGVAGTWQLKQVATSSQLTGQRLDLRSPPGESAENVHVLGERAVAALMAVAVRRGFGVMLTERLPRGRLTHYGRRVFAGDRFDEFLDDVLGVTVYSDSPRVGFACLPAPRLLTGTTADALLAQWSEALTDAVPASDAVLTSFDLWSSSRSENSSRARLLLLVMAVEALVEQALRPPNEIDIVENLMRQVSESDLGETSKRRLAGGLSLLRRESVSTSCQR
jgi:hypothetical protein